MLTQKDTVTLRGSVTPVRMAVNAAGTYLYVISCAPFGSIAVHRLACAY